ncbi:hypothetical protein K443DRAFT_33939, partial [Laccaria amethystina LaAM-08-1]
MAPTYKSVEILASDSDLDDDDLGTAVIPEQLDKQAQPPSPPATVTKARKHKHQEKGTPYKPGSTATQTLTPMLIFPSIMNGLIVGLPQ